MPTKKILKKDRNCMGVFKIHASGLLIDGRDYYRAFYQAALRARRYILIAGWQFDSTVDLLRGDDREKSEGEVQLLPFLNSLCDKNPELEIYILAWDFNVIYSLDRELLQDWLFNWNSHEHIQFIFDDRHAIGSSHHQKLVVIDGVTGFVGGMDICLNRWDDRKHSPDNPLRKNREGELYEQYHDIQSFHSGPAADRLKEIFLQRWKHAGGDELELPSMVQFSEIEIEPSILIDAGEAAFSRTQSRTLLPPQETIREIRSLFLDAIEAADQLIYIENQYFSSQAIYEAMRKRFTASDRPPLQVVMILPKQPHSLLENISLGIAQAKMLQSLNETASQHGHAIGIYYTAPLSKEGSESPTYIHAKLLLIDDRFLSVGSANTNNRSMGLDTELNISWEADSYDQKSLIESIRRARASLLAEHCGFSTEEKQKHLHSIEGLVEHLNRYADDPACRLRHHTMESLIDDIEALSDLKTDDISIDPERPILEENIYDMISQDKSGFFAEGVSWLNDYLKTSPWKRPAMAMGRVKAGYGQEPKSTNAALSLLYAAGYVLKSRWYIVLVTLLLCAFVLWLVMK